MNLSIKKGKSIEYCRYDFAFDIPKEHEKQFLDIIKAMKEAGIKIKTKEGK